MLWLNKNILKVLVSQLLRKEPNKYKHVNLNAKTSVFKFYAAVQDSQERVALGLISNFVTNYIFIKSQ